MRSESCPPAAPSSSSAAGSLLGLSSTTGTRRGKTFVEPGAAERRRHQDEAVDAPVQRLQQRRRLRRVAVRARHQQVVAGGARGEVDAAHDLAEEGAVHVGQQHADRHRPPRRQAARGAVRHVAQPLDGVEHALARLGAHGPLVVEHPRHGGHRGAGGAGDLVDRGRGDRLTSRSRRGADRAGVAHALQATRELGVTAYNRADCKRFQRRVSSGDCGRRAPPHGRAGRVSNARAALTCGTPSPDRWDSGASAGG